MIETSSATTPSKPAPMAQETIANDQGPTERFSDVTARERGALHSGQWTAVRPRRLYAQTGQDASLVERKASRRGRGATAGSRMAACCDEGDGVGIVTGEDTGLGAGVFVGGGAGMEGPV